MRNPPTGKPRSTLDADALAARDVDARLAELDRHLSLSADEQVERARLKKLKLAIKDRLARAGG
jgi:hypothetical protein